MNSTFITTHLSRAFALDSKLSSHPVEVECPDANHIEDVRRTPDHLDNQSKANLAS